jgi:hypothetical protein
VRRLLFSLLLFGCGPPEPSYQVSCNSVVCEDADLERDEDEYKRCSWCVNSLEARVVTFRRIDGCWGIEREFDWAEGQCIMFNRF